MLPSFLITGPYTQWTNDLILSIKKYYPLSQIVFSTWEDKNLSNCTNVDELVVNNESELLIFNQHQHFSNIFFSAKKGLNFIKSNYTIRVRSDLRFVSNNLINFTDHKLKKNSVELSIFKEKIRCPNLGSLMHKKVPFYFADISQFGLTEDLIKFFDVDLLPKSIRKVDYLIPNCKNAVALNLDIGNEHAVPLMCIKKYLNFSFSSTNFHDEKEKSIHDKILINNFVLLDTQTQYGITWEKYPSYGKGCDTEYFNKTYKRLIEKN